MEPSSSSLQLKMAMIGETYLGSQDHIEQLAEQTVARIHRNPNVYAARVVAEKAREAELNPSQVNRLVEETNRSIVKNILLSEKKAQANLRVDKKEVKDIIEGFDKEPSSESLEKDGPGAPLSTEGGDLLKKSMAKQANFAMQDYEESPEVDPSAWGFSPEGYSDEEDEEGAPEEENFLFPLNAEDEQGPIRSNPHASGIFPMDSGETSLAQMGWWNETPSYDADKPREMQWGSDGFMDAEDHMQIAKEGYVKKVREYMQLVKKAMLEGDRFHDLVSATLLVKGDQDSVDMLKEASSYLHHFNLLSDEERDNWQAILTKSRNDFPPAISKEAMVKEGSGGPVSESLLNPDTKQYYKRINGSHVLVRKLREIHDCENEFRVLKARSGGTDSGAMKYVRKTNSLDGQYGS